MVQTDFEKYILNWNGQKFNKDKNKENFQLKMSVDYSDSRINTD